MGLPRYWVNASSLMLVVEDTDFAYSGLGPAVSFKRTYNSTPSLGGMFGNGWSFVYDWDVTNTCKGALLCRGSGQLHYYKTTSLCPEGSIAPPVTTTPPEGVYDTLTLQEDNSWLLESQKKETVRRFAYNGTTKKYHLSSITDRNGNALTIARDGDGRIQTVTDAAGRSTAFTIDGSGRCTRMTFPDGLFATFSYDAEGNLLTSTDRLGTVTTYTYDADKYMTSLAVADKTTVFTYTEDTPRQIQSVANALGDAVISGQEPSTGEVTITSPTGAQSRYEHKGALLTNARDPSGANAFRFAYTGGRPLQATDPLNQVSTMSYDPKGNLTQKTDPLGHATEYAYTASSRLSAYVTQKGDTWSFSYDANGNLVQSTSPGGGVTRLTYFPNGNMASRVDANGGTTLYTYDVFGNLASTTDPLGHTTTFQYDASGLNMTSRTDPRGNTTTYQVDALRRFTRITNPDGTFMTNAYDCCATTSFTDEKGVTTTMQRNKLLRPTSVVLGTGSTTTYAYDADERLIKVTDPNGGQVSITYDEAGRPTTLTNPLGDRVVKTYDANWNLTGFSDEKGNLTQFVYDENNRLVQTIDPLSKTTVFERDPQGNIVAITNARHQTIARTYDPEGRVTQKEYDGIRATSLSYDNLGGITGYTDASGETLWTRDGSGRVTTIAYPDGGTATRTYDPVGNTLTMAYPGGLTATSVYDARNRPTSVSWVGGGVTLSYDASGNILSETRSNGTSTEYTYDDLGRILSILHRRGANTLAARDYERDPAGNVTHESGTPILPMALTDLIATAVFNKANQLTGFSGDTYTYDDDGNLASISGGRTWLLTHDPENRPTSITRSGVTTTYTYDALGRRVRSITGSVTRHYHYDEKDRLLYETSGSGALVVSYLYHGNRLIAMKTAGGAVYYYHYDATGNTLAMTDASGATVRAYCYGPFGEIVNQTGSLYNPFTYAGEWGVMDEGNGLYLMRYRHYDAVTGRFLQKDPIGFAGGSNLYVYSGNNPVTMVDPKGFAGWASKLKVSEDGQVVPQSEDFVQTVTTVSPPNSTLGGKVLQVADWAMNFAPEPIGLGYTGVKILYKLGKAYCTSDEDKRYENLTGAGLEALNEVIGYAAGKYFASDMIANVIGAELDIAEDLSDAEGLIPALQGAYESGPSTESLYTPEYHEEHAYY